MVEKDAEKSILESMPQEILIKILCRVDHDDLKQLFHVSSTIRDATIRARKSHFAYNTPSKVLVFRDSLDWEELEELQAPNAPTKQSRRGRSRLKGKPSFAAALFLDEE